MINELKTLQQNFINIKFENLCLKEKLDKFSNGIENQADNEVEMLENIQNISNNTNHILHNDLNNNENFNGKTRQMKSFGNIGNLKIYLDFFYFYNFISIYLNSLKNIFSFW